MYAKSLALKSTIKSCAEQGRRYGKA